MKKQRLIMLVIVICLLAVLIPITVSAAGIGWRQENGHWYYDYSYNSYYDYYYYYSDGVYEIDGKLYCFDTVGRLITTPGELYYGGYSYYVGDGGVLYRNQWREDTTGYASEVGWVYYGSNGRPVTGFAVINGRQYYFDSYGIMQTRTVGVTSGKVFVFDENGIGTEKKGWFQHPTSKKWMYAENGALTKGMAKIDGGIYGFYNDGTMVTSDYITVNHVDNGLYGCYLFDKDGLLITKTGWKSVNGHWYYVVDNYGRLQERWFQLAGKWYYLEPELVSNTIFQDPNSDQYYAANNDGVCTMLTGTGWKNLWNGNIYLENGRPVKNAWRYISGNWYYFNENCYVLTNGVYYIDYYYYLFGSDGKLATGGWYNVGGSIYYANPSGVISTGLQTIDGKLYLFASSGYLRSGGIYTYNSRMYWVGDDGAVIGQINEGWNQLNGKRYYVKNGTLQYDKLLTIDGVRYGFGTDYALCTAGVHYLWDDYYIFDSAGRVLTGWQQLDGKWYYANTNSSDPYLYWDGIYTIEGKRYAFIDGYMRIGSFFAWDQYITTAAGGVITSQTELRNGWNYTGSGYIYLKNGQWYTGWVGDYYIEGGYMQSLTAIEYAGKYYWLGADGCYVKKGWIQHPDGRWMYAKADGTLCCSEWLNLNGKHYYFNERYLVKDGYMSINGIYHLFDKDGVWQGEWNPNKTYPAKADGWQKVDGSWYYYHAGAPARGPRYIGGKWYYFAEDGMATNRVVNNYYYGSDGARSTSSGWKTIAGYKCYFGATYRMLSGWQRISGKWYYFGYVYDENTNQELYSMVTGKGICYNGKLYRFNSSGHCTGAVSGTGWVQAGSDWYYLVNGYALCDTTYKIDGVYYAFDIEGVMVTNSVCWVDAPFGGGYMFFGGNGKAVTKAGWQKYDGAWIYIGADGFLYRNGIYKIGSTDYNFSGIKWVQ